MTLFAGASPAAWLLESVFVAGSMSVAAPGFSVLWSDEGEPALTGKRLRYYMSDFPMASVQGHPQVIALPHLGASTREAKEVCRGCVVRLDCLEFALVNGEIMMPSRATPPR